MEQSKRTIYAPIRRHLAGASRSSEAPASGQQTGIKFVDDQEDEEHFQAGESYSRSARSSRWKNLRSSPTRLHKSREAAKVHGNTIEAEKQAHKQVYQQQHKQQEINSEPEVEVDLAAELEADDERARVEEVYLCSCCGATDQLEPAMKYLPLFRSLFVLFNCLALAFGAASLALGLWFRIDPKVFELHRHIETQNFTIAGWLMLAGGLATCLLTLAIGCAASGRNSICLLLSYTICLGLLAIGSIGTLVLLTVYGLGDSLERFLTKEVYEQIRRRAMGIDSLPQLAEASSLNSFLAAGPESAAHFMDFVQVKLRCCGAIDFRDYSKLGQTVPTTCYTIAANFVNAPGCGQALRELLDLRAGLAAGCMAAQTLAQLLASIFAALMICSIYNYRATPRASSTLSAATRSRPHSRSSSGLPARHADSPTSEPLRPIQFQRVAKNYPLGTSSPPLSGGIHSIEV